jgi:interferon gamma-inducible protein 30
MTLISQQTIVVLVSSTLLICGVIGAVALSFHGAASSRTPVVAPIQVSAALDAPAAQNIDKHLVDGNPPTVIDLKNGPKVEVVVYYEAFCPYCQRFITKALWQAWNSFGLKDIMSVELVPWGNANSVFLMDESYNFTCDHGPEECRANMWQACAVDTVKQADKQLEYIVCLEKSKDAVAAEEHCAKAVKIDFAAIQTCFQTRGNHLLHDMQLKTEKLSPPLKGVPWVTVANEALQDADDVLEAVCKHYKGPKPIGCLFVERAGIAEALV